jgi:hypothetical protein
MKSRSAGRKKTVVPSDGVTPLELQFNSGYSQKGEAPSGNEHKVPFKKRKAMDVLDQGKGKGSEHVKVSSSSKVSQASDDNAAEPLLDLASLCETAQPIHGQSSSNLRLVIADAPAWVNNFTATFNKVGRPY